LNHDGIRTVRTFQLGLAVGLTVVVAEGRTLIARGGVDMIADAEAIDRFADWKRHTMTVVRRAKSRDAVTSLV
jgi:hypothetical protein